MGKRSVEGEPDIYQRKESGKEKKSEKDEKDEKEYHELHDASLALMYAIDAIKSDNQQAKALKAELRARYEEIGAKLEKNPLEQRVRREQTERAKEKTPPVPWVFNEEDKRTQKEINELTFRMQQELASGDVAEVNRLKEERDKLQEKIAPKEEALKAHLIEFDESFKQGH